MNKNANSADVRCLTRATRKSLVVNIKIEKFCLLTQFSVKVLRRSKQWMPKDLNWIRIDIQFDEIFSKPKINPRRLKFLQKSLWNYRNENKHFLILPSSISRYSSAFKTKIIFQILWCIFEGWTNRAQPSLPSLKSYQNGTF